MLSGAARGGGLFCHGLGSGLAVNIVATSDALRHRPRVHQREARATRASRSAGMRVF